MDTPADLIRRERRRKLLTQGELAAATGIPQQRISGYERGTVSPRWETLVRLFAGMKLQPRLLLEALDSDVDALIDALARRPPEAWFDDMAGAFERLLEFLEDLPHRYEDMTAARIHGAPVPLHELQVAVALDEAAWTSLARRALRWLTPVWDPLDQRYAVPESVRTLKAIAADCDQRLTWILLGVPIRMRVATHVETPVRVAYAGRLLPVTPLPDLTASDPDVVRMLDRVRARKTAG